MSDLAKYILTGSTEKLMSISTVDDRIQQSRPGTAIFYYLHSNPDSESRLQEYLRKHRPDVLILNRNFPVDVPLIVAQEDRWLDFQKHLCDIHFPLPEKAKIIAITGTNGKTTTADLVLQLSSLCGLRAISIGTLGVRSEKGLLEDFGLTTPSFIQLRRILFQYAQTCDVVAMEASSHALEQSRVTGLTFFSGAWTNLTQDHLDYHKTMDAYFEAKKKIFNYLRSGGTVFLPSTQKDLAKKIARPESCKVLAGLDGEVKARLPSFFKTKFNLDNLSLALALVAEVNPAVMNVDTRSILPTPGRFYIKEWDNRAAIVDFAHTPDALENLLSAVREIYPLHKMKVLFGCGGDRDRGKRPLMGLAVQKYADELILTSDNPRTEDPMQIIDDIAEPLDPKKYKKIEDRPTALISELKNLGAMEVLVVAGKGHEDYIIKGTTKHPYSDILTLDNFLQGRAT
jgi:UDP-N-acetylmuramoyl-L-alanyl-D-glutamate--2,6-diaminopimelate ligase